MKEWWRKIKELNTGGGELQTKLQSCIQAFVCVLVCEFESENMRVSVKNIWRKTRGVIVEKFLLGDPLMTAPNTIHPNPRASNCMRMSGLAYITCFIRLLLCVWNWAQCAGYDHIWHQGNTIRKFKLNSFFNQKEADGKLFQVWLPCWTKSREVSFWGLSQAVTV